MSLGTIFGLSAGTAAAFAVVATLLSLTGVTEGRRWWLPSFTFSPSRHDLFAGLASLVLLTGINMLFFAWWMPVFAGAGWVTFVVVDLFIVALIFGGFDILEERQRHEKIEKTNATRSSWDRLPYRRRDVQLSLAWIVSLVLAIFILVGPALTWNNVWFGPENAEKLASQLDVEFVDQLNAPVEDDKSPTGDKKPSNEDKKEYPATDQNHMVIVGEQNARLTAKSIMGHENIGTRYILGAGELQSVGEHMYYVFALGFKDLKSAQDAFMKVPGYVMVDAEDPNVGPVLKDGYEIKYLLGGPYGSSLDRLVYDRYKSYFVDDLSLEVDDAGRPFYTAALNRPVVRWQESVPQKFITIDAQTGAIVEYDLDKVPAWVDRVLSAKTAKIMLDWWGHWGQADYAYWRERPADRYKVNGELNLVYTDEGAAWQAVMVSYTDETAVQYVALMDTRTMKVRVYRAPTGLLTEGRVADAFEASPNNLTKLDPTGLVLHKVFGKLVWVGVLVKDGKAGATDKGYPTAEPFAGVGVLEATNADAAKVIIGPDKGNAFARLSTQVAMGGNNNSPEANANSKAIEGTIASIESVVMNGSTFRIIMIEGDGRIFRAQVTDTASSLAMMFARPGDRVKISYLDSGVSILNVSSFTNDRLPGIK